jgi:hypothetical protein
MPLTPNSLEMTCLEMGDAKPFSKHKKHGSCNFRDLFVGKAIGLPARIHRTSHSSKLGD